MLAPLNQAAILSAPRSASHNTAKPSDTSPPLRRSYADFLIVTIASSPEKGQRKLIDDYADLMQLGILELNTILLKGYVKDIVHCFHPPVCADCSVRKLRKICL